MTTNDTPFHAAGSAGPAGAPAARSAQRMLGAILVAAGRLDPGETKKILARQRAAGQSFGQAAISLGLLTAADVELALARQFDSPYLLSDSTALSSELVQAFSPFGAEAEAIRVLRTELTQRWFHGPGQHALAITSVEPHEGRTFVASNLAVAFAQLGQRTLLIDADLRNPRQHALFGLSNRVGLSALLTGRAGAEAVQQIPEMTGLSVLTSGAAPPNPAELLGRPGFGKLVGALARYYDVVLIDTPAAGPQVDARCVALCAGAALVVARKDSSPLGGVSALSQSMSGSGITVLGAILNQF
ncbi:polysaccharide biosynthesis tyrosine autokinase [Massilia sp. CF038]|uniref:polysaccharide biosynthesis tyrosine autokinase n=1 Tax=Massilia sp. CF038 TaxID=1881045 RepID=UPI000921B589|nr:polysaccharide biosynthesis tyrosine autokinase [Massilia sp. CF038]SHH11967.1 receptor protein-tyrosine kinase [Massilia sp. CF038]